VQVVQQRVGCDLFHFPFVDAGRALSAGARSCEKVLRSPSRIAPGISCVNGADYVFHDVVVYDGDAQHAASTFRQVPCVALAVAPCIAHLRPSWDIEHVFVHNRVHIAVHKTVHQMAQRAAGFLEGLDHVGVEFICVHVAN